MSTEFISVGTLLQLLTDRREPLLRLIRRWRELSEGHPDARSYFQSRDFLKDVVEVLYPDRTALLEDLLTRGEDLAQALKIFLRGEAPWVEAEYRPVVPPWDSFIERLKKSRHGVHIIFGPRGSGKTTLGKKLVWVWMDQLGYEPEFVNTYGNDLPSWGKCIMAETFIKRIERLNQHLQSQATPDPEEQLPTPPPDPGKPPGAKAIMLDETSITFTRGQIDALRRAVEIAACNARHLEWQMVFIGQNARVIPLELFANATAVWIKNPRGTEQFFDRDNSLIEEYWERARE
ncbi:MAG: hypothetical protein C4292_05955, partial [Nitrososphaera sp.]